MATYNQRDRRQRRAMTLRMLSLGSEDMLLFNPTARREALGSGFVDAYVKLQMAHWTDYMRHLTEWEREHTLDVY
jgi:glutamine synthetase